MKRTLPQVISLFCLVSANAFATYDPSAGKWISRDPLEEQGGINLTQFCRNDPMNNVDPLGLRNEPANTLSFTQDDQSAKTEALYPDKRWGDRDFAGGRLLKRTSLEEAQEDLELFVMVAGDGSEMVVGTLWAPAGWAFDARDMSHAIGDIKRGAFVSGSICVVATGIGYLPAGDIVKKPVLRLVNWIRRSSKAGLDEAVEKVAKETAENAAKDGWVRKGNRLTRSYGPTVPKGNYYENYEQINWAAKTPTCTQLEFPFARGASVQTPGVTAAGESFVRVGANHRNLNLTFETPGGVQPGTYAFPESTFNAVGRNPAALQNLGDLPGAAPQYYRVLQPPAGTPIQRGIVPGGQYGGVGGMEEVIFPGGF